MTAFPAADTAMATSAASSVMPSLAAPTVTTVSGPGAGFIVAPIPLTDITATEPRVAPRSAHSL